MKKACVFVCIYIHAYTHTYAQDKVKDAEEAFNQALTLGISCKETFPLTTFIVQQVR